MTTTPEALKLARDALAAIVGSTVRPTTPSDGAALNAGRAALAAIDALPAPSGEPAEYLFLQTDDDGRAWHRWCANHAEVREAVKAAMFFVADGEDLSAEHTDQLDASVEVLIDDGHLSFEGDPPLYLFRMGGAALEKAPTTAQAAPASQAASQAPAVPAESGPPNGYEAITPVYTRWVSPDRWAKFSPAVQKWYRPYWLAATPQEAPAPLTDEQAQALWVSATIERTDMRSVYLRGLRDGERSHGITAPTAPTGGEG